VGAENLGGITSLDFATPMGECSLFPPFSSDFVRFINDLKELLLIGKLRVVKDSEPLLTVSATCLPLRVGGRSVGQAFFVKGSLFRSVTLRATGKWTLGEVWEAHEAFLCSTECTEELTQTAKNILQKFLSDRLKTEEAIK
jgi:hypothetical protein